MKEAFREYRVFTEEEMKEVWGKALVVVDTNVILDFYCFGEKTLADYYSVLDTIKAKGNLWMPHQVGYEFHENRVGIISKQLKQYENIISHIDTAKDKILALADSSRGHAQLDFKEIAAQYESKVKPLTVRVQRLRDKHPDHLEKDSILAKLEEIYTDDIVGSEFTSEELKALIEEGESRYAKNIPPGYKDQKKDDEEARLVQRKYGDLAIWKQIIKKAQDSKSPVIFVTNDAKDDWVRYAQEKRRLGAKPYLRKELLKEAEVDFFLFSSDEFLESAHKQFNLAVEESSVNEVKKYRELENARIHSDYSEDKTTRNRDVHGYLHNAMSLAEKCHRLFDSADAPSRAMETVKEIISIYRKVHSSFGYNRRTFQSFDAEDVMVYLERVEALLRRCVNITQHLENDNDIFVILEDLMYANKKLVRYLSSEDGLVQSHLLF